MHLLRHRAISMIALPLLVIMISSCANRLFYYPDKIDYGWGPTYFNQQYKVHQWRNDDGLKLTGWFIPAQKEGELIKEPIGTLLFAHGNAANISNHYALIAWLSQEGVNLFIFDYRGFGNSEGKPSFQGIDQDTVSALQYLKTIPSVDPNRLIIMGQSLGGNSVIAALSEPENQKGVQGIIIDSTFYDHSSIANHYFPAGALFVSGGYGASQKIEKLPPIPLLFIHGKQDEVIPYQHSEKLYQKAKEPKELLLMPDLKHMETTGDPIVQQRIIQFIHEHLDSLR